MFQISILTQIIVHQTQNLERQNVTAPPTSTFPIQNSTRIWFLKNQIHLSGVATTAKKPGSRPPQLLFRGEMLFCVSEGWGLRQTVHQCVPHTHSLLRRRRTSDACLPTQCSAAATSRRRQQQTAATRSPLSATSFTQLTGFLLSRRQTDPNPLATYTETHVSLQAHPCHTTCYLPPHPSVREGRRFAAAIHTFSETRERARACSLVILHLAHDF
jgi:hypothetical protein